MKAAYLVIAISLISMSCLLSCKKKKTEEDPMPIKEERKNPLLEESTLPFYAPDFTQIKDSDFRPAFQKAMNEQNATISKIINNKEKATFENTILELEKSGDLLEQVSNVFYALTGANTNDSLKVIQEEITPLLTQHWDNIQLNPQLFERIQNIYNELGTLNLDAESRRLVEFYFDNAVKAGAKLSEEDKEQLKTINSELSSLQNAFNQRLLDANNAGALIFNSPEPLAGLNESELNSLRQEDSVTFKIPLLNTTQQPLLQKLTNRKTRQALYDASIHRADHGEFNTSDIILKMAKLRAKKAALLGHDNYAAWSLQESMAKTPERVMDFFAGLVPAATAKAQKEQDDIQKKINASGQKFTCEPYDWNLFAEQVRQERYDLDEEQIKPYFELVNVLENGVFYAAKRLYGLKFRPRKDIPTYHPDVLVYELFEEDGSALGLFYADFYARPSKRGGAWMSNFVNQSKLFDRKPVIYNVMNIAKPAEGNPTLLTYDEVETMFHEFGHALHGFFADQFYPSLSGTNVARDFVEFPSQFNENWALQPEILAHYAIHNATGEQIPDELVTKIKNASTFNQGYSLTELLAAANLDMQWHMQPADKNFQNVEQFEKEALHKTKLDRVHAVPPRYKSTYFAHIFGGGYAASYYAYLWTEMLDHDAYDWFLEHGDLTRENGQRFREMILSKGNTEDYEVMYRNWRGQDPTIKPMEKARGLIE